MIPSLLSNGVNLVKGEKFDNWRTVGSVFAAVELFSKRDVDEILLLDVCATPQHRLVDSHLVGKLAKRLRIPFSVGGGISQIAQIELLLANGADKVVIGKAAIENSELLTSAARIFGSQALVVSLDVAPYIDSKLTAVQNDPHSSPRLKDVIRRIADSGAGEAILQNSKFDGTMQGLQLEYLYEVLAESDIPLIVAGGMKAPGDAVEAARAGAAGVGVGALFQFTEVTPTQVKDSLEYSGIPVRR